MEAARLPWPALGVLLIRDGLVTADELEEVLARQGDDREHRISSQRLGEALVADGIVTSGQIARLIAEQHELPFVDLAELDARVPCLRVLPEDVSRRHAALAIRRFPDGSVLVAVADPTRAGCFDDIRSEVGVPVRFAVAAAEEIEAALEADAAWVAERELSVEAEEAEDVQDIDAPISPAPEEEPHEAEAERPWPVLGSLLLRDGLVTEEELDAALAQQRLSSTRRLGEILVARGVLTEAHVSRALAEQHELPFLDLGEHEVDADAARRLPPDVSRAYLALPVAELPDGALLVVVADPASAVHSEELRNALGVPLRFAIATSVQIEAALDSLSGATGDGANAPPKATQDAAPLLALAAAPPAGNGVPPEVVGPAHDSDPEPAEDGALDDSAAVADLPDEPPVEEAEPVLHLVERALAGGASAVHLVPSEDGLSLLTRIDGALETFESLSTERAHAVRREAKDLARRPLRTVELDGRAFELRAAVLPTLLGERVTFAVREPAPPLSLAELGLEETTASALRDAVARGSGLVLVAGAPGSARTTTLHAVLAEIDPAGKAVLTIEDPVERLHPGVDHAQVDQAAGATFASGLRAVLRSDPDVVLVGDLGDPTTARLATEAATDGPLVLAGLEAESAAAGIGRLLTLGVHPLALAKALGAVVGQALVATVCPDCREAYYASGDELADLGLPPDELGRRLLPRGRGCDACAGTGFAGHVTLHEALQLTHDVRARIAAGGGSADIERAAVTAGMRTLAEQAAARCVEGVTTAAQVRALTRSAT